MSAKIKRARPVLTLLLSLLFAAAIGGCAGGRAVQKTPKAAVRSYERGIAAAVEGDFEKAVEHFAEAIRLAPDFYDAYEKRGCLYEGIDDRKALADLNSAIKLNPGRFEPYNCRGIVNYNLGNIDESFADFTRVIELNPDFAPAYSSRGIVYNEKGETAKAIADLDRAIELNPDDNAYNNRGFLFSEIGDFDNAIVDLTKAIEINPNHVEALITRGNAFLNNDDLEKAVADFNRALSLRPDDAGVYNSRGVAHFSMENYGGAIADYDKAIKIDPEYAEAYANRGVAHAHDGNIDGAIDDLQAALRINPDNMEVKRFLREIMMEFGEAGAKRPVTPLILDGGFEIYVIDDVPGREMDAGLFDGPLTEERRLEFMPGGKAPAAVNVFLVKTGGKTYLIDAGFGNAAGEGRLDPSAVDAVLITHEHGDHISGLINENSARFAGQVFVSQPERAYWNDPSTPNSDLQKNIAGVYGDRYKTFAFGDTLAPGIVAINASGHTPGHTAFLIGTGGQKLLVAGDFLHAAALQFPNPDESARFDIDPKGAAERRKELMAMAETNGWLIAGNHIRGGYGRVKSDGRGGFEFTRQGE